MDQTRGDDGGYGWQEDNTYSYSKEKGGFVNRSQRRSQAPGHSARAHASADPYRSPTEPEVRGHGKFRPAGEPMSGIGSVLLFLGGVFSASIALALLTGGREQASRPQSRPAGAVPSRFIGDGRNMLAGGGIQHHGSVDIRQQGTGSQPQRK